MERCYKRRRLLGFVPAAVAVALTGDVTWATPECRGEGHPCEGNQECCGGLTCIEGADQDSAKRCTDTTPPPIPCDHDSHCPDNCVCSDGGCYTVIVVDGITVFVPVTVTVNGGGTKRRKRRRRKHRKH